MQNFQTLVSQNRYLKTEKRIFFKDAFWITNVWCVFFSYQIQIINSISHLHDLIGTKKKIKKKWYSCSCIYLKLSNINLNDQTLTLSARIKWLLTIIFLGVPLQLHKSIFPPLPKNMNKRSQWNLSIIWFKYAIVIVNHIVEICNEHANRI